MTEWIECMATCAHCGLVDLRFYVPVRKDGQDVVEWMHKVFTPKASEAHHFWSPHCRPDQLTNVKIPMSSKGIGFALVGDELKVAIQ